MLDGMSLFWFNILIYVDLKCKWWRYCLILDLCFLNSLSFITFGTLVKHLSLERSRFCVQIFAG